MICRATNPPEHYVGSSNLCGRASYPQLIIQPLLGDHSVYELGRDEGVLCVTQLSALPEVRLSTGPAFEHRHSWQVEKPFSRARPASFDSLTLTTSCWATIGHSCLKGITEPTWTASCVVVA